eukprot:m.342696 g.342696  ORF g.342696 m.342696 type:complete len:1574 (+) comp16126_c0_seq1:154-4875(+)
MRNRVFSWIALLSLAFSVTVVGYTHAIGACTPSNTLCVEANFNTVLANTWMQINSTVLNITTEHQNITVFFITGLAHGEITWHPDVRGREEFKDRLPFVVNGSEIEAGFLIFNHDDAEDFITEPVNVTFEVLVLAGNEVRTLKPTLTLLPKPDHTPPFMTRSAALTAYEDHTYYIHEGHITFEDDFEDDPKNIRFVLHTGSQSALGASVYVDPLWYESYDEEYTGQFTMQNLIDRQVRYTYRQELGPFAKQDYFVYNVSDRSNNTAVHVFNITLLPRDDQYPVVNAVNPVVCHEGGRAYVNLSHIDMYDIDTIATRVTVVFYSSLNHGRLDMQGHSSLTLDLLNQSVVEYIHDSSETLSDEIRFRVTDGSRYTDYYSLPFTIIPVDDTAPEVDVNNFEVNEGGTFILTPQQFNASDLDTNSSSVFLSLTRPLQNAIIEGRWPNGSSFAPVSMQDIVNGRAVFVHDNSETSFVNVYLSFIDAAGNESPERVATVTILPVDDEPPTLLAQRNVTVLEGGRVAISSLELAIVDVDSNSTDVSVVVNTAPSLGNLVWKGTNETLTAFSIANLTSGAVWYEHGDTETRHDSFSITATDAHNNSASLIIHVDVTVVDDHPPVLDWVQNGTLPEGGSLDLSTVLSVSDPDTVERLVRFDVRTTPFTGAIKVDGSIDYTFTLEQLNNNLVTYVHNGNESFADSFSLLTTDAQGAQLPLISIWLTVTPVDDLPPSITQNVTIHVVESACTPLTGTVVVADGDTTSDALLVNVTTAPSRASLVYTNSTCGNRVVVSSTTGSVISYPLDCAGEVLLCQDGSNVAFDTMVVRVCDAGHSCTFNHPINVNVTVLDDDPPIPSFNQVALRILQEQTLNISALNLTATDPDSPRSNITWSVDNTTAFDAPDTPLSFSFLPTTFTQIELDQGTVPCSANTSSATVGDYLVALTVSDAMNNTNATAVIVSVSPLPPCGDGTMYNAFRTQCLPCPTGYAGQEGLCDQCPWGTQPDAFAVACENCTFGEYGVNGTCYKCPAGSIGTIEGAFSCTQCTPGTYQNSTGQSSCLPVNPCSGYVFELRPPTSSSDRLCQPVTQCTNTQYQVAPSTLKSDTVCDNITTCDFSFQYQSVPPSNTSDSICLNITRCMNALSLYQLVAPTNVSDAVCANLTNCTGAHFESIAPTATTNRECSNLTVCHASQFESVAPLATRDRYCTNCTTCPLTSFELAPCTTTSDTICSNCTTCSSSQYKISSCSSEKDAVCANCTTCIDGSTFETEPCRPDANRVCSTCQACDLRSFFELSPCGNGTDRVCAPLTFCTAGQFEEVAPTPTSNRVCGACDGVLEYQDEANATECLSISHCAPGTFVSLAPSPSTDRQCTPCPNSTFQTQVDSPSCDAWTVCNETQYIANVPNSTVDTQCVALTQCALTQFELTPPTLTEDRICQDLTPCNSTTQFVSINETATSDRTCMTLRTCTQAQFESLPPTTFSDRACDELTNCTSDQYQAAPPTPTSNRECVNITVCGSTQYEVSAPTLTSQRICATPTECHSVTEFVTANHTATTDRICGVRSAFLAETAAVPLITCTVAIGA